MRYLVVDDEKPALDYMKELLEEADEGCVCEFYQTSDEALKRAVDEDFDVCFFDIKIGRNSGIELAKKIKALKPHTNFVFTTGYSDFMKDAFDLDASAYLLKPVDAGRIKHALENLRYRRTGPKEGITFKCFGNFDCFVNGERVIFKYKKAREMLAYLVYRNGSVCSKNEIISALWEEDMHDSYYRRIKKDMIDALEKSGAKDLIYSARGIIALRKRTDIKCDYFSWLNDEPEGINAYNGEFMSEYSWGEDFLGERMLREGL